MLQILQMRAHKPSLCFLQIKLDGETTHLTTACRCVYLYVRLQPSMHVVSVGQGCFYLKRSMTKRVEYGLPPVIFHFWGHKRAPDLCHDACPCVEKLRRVRPHRCESFNTEFLVFTDEISALHQHVFIFHGQHNGIHGWESIQTCVGNTLVAANPLLFCAQDFMWTN